MIYFIKSESGHIKIGYTENNALERMAVFQPGCPFKLTLIKTIEGDRQQETLIHKRYKKDNRHNEWFNLSEELTDFIENPFKIVAAIKKQRIKDTYILTETGRKIKVLIQQKGSKENVAKMLGITTRHLENCLKGKHIGKPLRKLIRFYSVQFRP